MYPIGFVIAYLHPFSHYKMQQQTERRQRSTFENSLSNIRQKIITFVNNTCLLSAYIVEDILLFFLRLVLGELRYVYSHQVTQRTVIFETK